MRGGAQAHLMEADDGRFYVVKFQNNPQHRRILVNELVSSVLLRYLRIAVPDTALVRVTREFLDENSEVFIHLGARRVPVVPGWHFGSCFPGDPNRNAVYDFIPDVLLGKVVNLPDFVGALVLDKWTGNADARQAVFFRARIRDWVVGADAPQLQKGFIAQLVDHGYCFDGPHWDYADSPLQGLYMRPLVYQHVTGWDDFQPWLDQVVDFPDEVVDEAAKQVPAEWLESDEAAFQNLLEKLMSRRKRVPDLLRDCSRGRVDPFPNWH